jgi:sec-independent protein translocase protein TatB
MLGIPHLVVIFLVALVVLGPEKLPQVARMLGKAMADFRRITTDFRVQIEDEMQEMERQTRLKKEAAAAEATPPPAATPSDAPASASASAPAPAPASAEQPFSPEVPAEPSTGSENDFPGQANAPDHAASVEKTPNQIGSGPVTSELPAPEVPPTETAHHEKLADGDFDPA